MEEQQTGAHTERVFGNLIASSTPEVSGQYRYFANVFEKVPLGNRTFSQQVQHCPGQEAEMPLLDRSWAKSDHSPLRFVRFGSFLLANVKDFHWFKYRGRHSRFLPLCQRAKSDAASTRRSLESAGLPYAWLLPRMI
ncbi:hypothetical protein NPIL_382651 [Nephila pilipes]|uniref:Uncharacterized protein n=1 Tax=Nephila pilipes TaxID=299642 RepID=A0A8X6TRU2_NEPPI|nr:hypothetical protein NPIL_382651 [Nephila pilipes]